MERLTLTFLLFCIHASLSTESIYTKHSEVQDQETSASGYAYQLQSGGPLTYAAVGGGAQLGGGGLANHLIYPPLLGRYTQQLPLQLPLTTEYKPQGAPGVVPLNYGVHPYTLNYPLQSYPLQSYPLQNYPQQAQVYRPVPVAISDSSNFVKEGGASFSDANQKAQGEKGSTGYKSQQEFDKGAKGQHDAKGHKEYFTKEGANKAGHHDEAGHYGQKEEAAKGSQGSHFSEAKSHKKGSKTSGYHKVHHKDEYKKDHSFYDESDANGHFNKHGDFDEKHEVAKGGFEKGAHQDKGYDEGEQGVKGFVDQGYYNGENKGFKGEEGKEAYYKQLQDYAKKGEQEQEKAFGFSKKDVLQAQQ